MLFAADIGNSSVSFGVFGENGELLFKSKTDAAKSKSEDEYAVLFDGILHLNGCNPRQITNGILCSVVPSLTGTIRGAIRKLFGVDAPEVGPGIRTGLNIRVDAQTQLGADLVANAVATTAKAKPGNYPLVVVDLGTATTFTVIDGNGAMDGVIIAPGIRVSLDALARYGSELPDVSLIPPKRVIGKNTQDSMRSGTLYGHAAMIDGMLEKIRISLKAEKLTVILTGGFAETLLPYCAAGAEYCPDLTLTGLYLLHLKNRK